MTENPSGILSVMPIDVDAVVLSNNRLSPNYNVVAIAAPEIATQAQPGQFVMVKQTLDSEPLLRRPFSIFEILRDEDGKSKGLSLLNKPVGTVTRKLFKIESGERLQCLGPLGQPFSIASSPGAAWMVAGGVGLAPFLTLAETLREQEVETTLFYGGRSTVDLVYLESFKRLGVRLVLATEDGSRGEPGLVTLPLARALQTVSTDQPLNLYACGPTAMMQVVAELADTHGRSSEVSLEPVMGCGLGGCYSCVVPIHAQSNTTSSQLVRSCREGPVFGGNQVVWPELI